MRGGFQVLSEKDLPRFLAAWPSSRILAVEPEELDAAAALREIGRELGETRVERADSAVALPEMVAAVVARANALGGLVLLVKLRVHPSVSALWATTRALRTLAEQALLRLPADGPPVAVLLVLPPVRPKQ